jgi:D-alanine-D-alanine ligase
MKIGITYDLRDEYLARGYSEEETAEFDKTETIDALEQSLQSLGYRTERIGSMQSLVKLLSDGSRWDLVFNIAEGLHGFSREAAIPALLEAYRIPSTFSDPLVLSLTLHKGLTKHVIRALGIPTPDFAVIETERDVETIELPFPVFAKPIAEGTGKGISSASKISTRDDLRAICRMLLARYRQPVLVETFLPGRELTVGIVGTGAEARALGVMEIMLNEYAEPHAYTYENKEDYEKRVQYCLIDDTMAEQAREIALASWRGLGCRDAGRVDLRADISGTPNFLEVNPLAGLNPIHSDLPIICNLSGITYQTLIDMIVQSALRRISHPLPLIHSVPTPKVHRKILKGAARAKRAAGIKQA